MLKRLILGLIALILSSSFAWAQYSLEKLDSRLEPTEKWLYELMDEQKAFLRAEPKDAVDNADNASLLLIGLDTHLRTKLFELWTGIEINEKGTTLSIDDLLSEKENLALWTGGNDNSAESFDKPAQPLFWQYLSKALDNRISEKRDKSLDQQRLEKQIEINWYVYKKYGYTWRLFETIKYLTQNGDTKLAFELLKENKEKLQDLKDFNDYWDMFLEEYAFLFEEIEYEAEGDKPEVCIKFNIEVAHQQDFSELIQVNEKKAQVVYGADRLCLDGLTWEKNYQITISENLKSIERGFLLNPISQNLFVGKRKPMIRFAEKGKVLSYFDSQNINIEVANIQSAELRLFKINERNLNHSSMGSYIDNLSLSRYSHYLNDIANNYGEEILKAKLSFDEIAANKTENFNIALSDMIEDLSPSLYILALRENLEDEENYQEWQVMSFVVSDAGLSSFYTKDALSIELRSLKDYELLANKKVTLIAKNNSVLGEALTDDNGMAHFSKAQISGQGGSRPQYALYQGSDGKSFAYLDLLAHGFDLANYGLTGATPSHLFKTWIWTDRGVYRPGDHMEMMTMLRQDDKQMVDDIPLWIKLKRPDGKIMLSTKLKADESGVYLFNYDFAPAARLGKWVMDISIGEEGDIIKHHGVLVDAVIPRQIKVKASFAQEEIKEKSNIDLMVQGDWLYGQPASDIAGNGYWYIRQQKEYFENYKDWQIGLYNEDIYNKRQLFNLEKTDNKGQSVAQIDLSQLADYTQPVELYVTAGLRELSGENTTDNISAHIMRSQPYLALKREDKEAKIVLINEAEKLEEGNVNWKISRVYEDGHWIFKNGRWDYRVTQNFALYDEGALEIKGDIGSIKLPEASGAWLLEAYGDNPQIAASQIFYVGDYAPLSGNKQPEQLEIKTDKQRYQKGDKVKIEVISDFDGPVSLHLADDKIVKTLTSHVKKGRAEFTIKYDEKWDKGLWLLSNAYNKDNSSGNIRSIGLGWIGGDKEPYKLNIEIDAPKQALPGEKVDLSFSVKDYKGKAAQGKTWVTLAAVDEGLYSLAAPSYENPLDFFMKKERISLSINDIYGDLINQVEARNAAIRTGADGGIDAESLGQQNLPDLDIDMISFWSGPIVLDSDGKATISLDIPEFNGKLRLMAAAWNKNHMGGVEEFIQVKAPIVAQMASPYFLSQGDKADFSLRLQNTTEQSLDITYKIQTTGDISIKGDYAHQTLTLAPTESKLINTVISAEKAGAGEVSIDVSSADYHFSKSRKIDIRSNQLKLSEKKLIILKPGEKTQLTEDIPNWLDAEGLSNHIKADFLGGFDVKDIANSLSHYPYGCVEQTISKSWPYLYGQKLNQSWGISLPKDSKEVLSTALNRLSHMQGGNGGFGLWQGSNADLWVTSYVVDFYDDVEKHGFKMNPLSKIQAIEWIERHVKSEGLSHSSLNSPAYAYAYYILAKQGKISLPQLENYAQKAIVTGLGKIHLAAAFFHLGEASQGIEIISESLKTGFVRKDNQYYGDYGSTIRDLAQAVTILEELEAQFKSKELSSAIAPLRFNLYTYLGGNNWLSTQEQLWSLRMAAQMENPKEFLKLKINNRPYEGQGEVVEYIADKNVIVENISNQDIYIQRRISGNLKQDSRYSKDIDATIAYKDLEGNDVDLNNLKLNDVVVVLIQLDKKYDNPAELILAGLIPAGMSLEASNALLMNNAAFENLEEGYLYPQYSENRDDRHIAAFSTGQGKEKFNYFYVMRAARAGQWKAPGLAVEDMYAPQYRLQMPSYQVNIHSD